MGEEERAVQIKVDDRFPLVEGELVDSRAGARDDRTAADRVDQDVDAPEFAGDALDQRVDRVLVERVAQPVMRPAACGGDLGDRLL